MTSRELVFSNPAMIRLVRERFVPVADDVSRLQSADSEDARFFRDVAVQGHMKGRSRPENSHQGTYAFTADGVTLASGNPLRAEATMALLEEALEAWETRTGSVASDASHLPRDSRHTIGYPMPGGAVLRMSARDLPRPGGLPAGQERYATHWNFDHVWLRGQDVREFVPASTEIGCERKVSTGLLGRIARFHLRDIVRGEPWIWGPDAVERIGLTSRVTANDGDRVTLALRGGLVLREDIAFRDAHKPIDWAFENVLDATMAGEAVWNGADGQLERFDLLVAGQRSGAHRYNVRTADPGPAPIGFAFELAGDEPWERTPPHALRVWRRSGEAKPEAPLVVNGEPYYGTA